MTPFTLNSLSDLNAFPFDCIIDVRAQSEFAQDHLPGAINLPVLNDAERAQVGTIYSQESPFNARKIGGALVAQNTATHLQNALAGKTGDWQPLVYCWRGGHRSGAFATILSQVGWRVHLLQGGYRSYRRLIARHLYDAPLPHRLRLISGGTGTAKTALLQCLRGHGAQVVDLEGLANHRGSLFGAYDGPQPAQKMFESHIAAALAPLDPMQITWIEAESSKIGTRVLPPSLWTAMSAAPRVEITAPIGARAAFLCATYADITDNPAGLDAQLAHLQPFHSAATLKAWRALAASRNWQVLAEALIREHYDPSYLKSTTRSEASTQHITLPDLTEATLHATAQRLITEFQ